MTALLPVPGGLARALRVFRLGLGFGYPLCCVLRFAWDMALDRYPGVLRGSITRPAGESCVPCGLLHRTAPDTPCRLCIGDNRQPNRLCPAHRVAELERLARARPLLRHQPLEPRWPDRRCRLGWHRFLQRDVIAAREVDVAGRGRVVLVTRISACARCDCIRHEQNAAGRVVAAAAGEP
ncbi:hypothetical protein [Pseudonocardia sp. WMMC193]|uniref:hypothetical protein n=1 Tax=Pseudonocardia sp. WMMC193 TaxID=2911965 RepID=UPI001F1BF0DB|nr:hypothetical protein [Pseudonocardia sp. WMMC193]MCF7550999.1 hypothetical protein [Pseudonocardia sp. WMMC193]